MGNPLNYLLVAMATSFIATLPFGPINLGVVKTSVDHHRLGAIEFSLAASAVETVQALLAIWFGLVINAFIADHASINLLIALVFIGLAVYVFIHDTHPMLNDSDDDEPSFVRRGLVIALLNPQAIPFWIFAVTAITRYLGFVYEDAQLLGFLAGVYLGKSLALSGFIIASDYLKTHLNESSQLVNYLLAAVLLLIGLSQIWRAFSAW